MNSNQPRHQEQIFSELFNQLRQYNRNIPESPDRMDSVMKLLLQAFSHSLSKTDAQLQQTWDQARVSLIRSVCPGPGRWPVPAHTVMRCVPIDDSIIVDTNTQFYYKEERKGGSTFFFAPIAESRVLKASTHSVLLCSENEVYDMSLSDDSGAPRTTIPKPPGSNSGKWNMYVGIQFEGLQSAFQEAVLYLKAEAEVQKQIRWGDWYFGQKEDFLSPAEPYCPGRANNLDSIIKPEKGAFDWGGFRDVSSLFQDIENGFIRLPSERLTGWRATPISSSLAKKCSQSGVKVPSADENLYWISIELPENCDLSLITRPVEFCFDAIIATNRSEHPLLRHSGGRRLFEIDIPVELTQILEIVSVIDSSGREYKSIEMSMNGDNDSTYSLEERDGNRLVVWIDLSASLEEPPDRVSLIYSVTDNIKANGIAAGKITTLYQNHPGLERVVNLTTVTGGVPAKTEDQVVREVAVRLRQRDRALTFSDITDWCLTFDPRIEQAECQIAIERIDNKVLRCIKVQVSVKPESFLGQNELEELKNRLEIFLKSRSTVNTRYLVEIVTK